MAGPQPINAGHSWRAWLAGPADACLLAGAGRSATVSGMTLEQLCSDKFCEKTLPRFLLWTAGGGIACAIYLLDGVIKFLLVASCWLSSGTKVLVLFVQCC